MITTACDGCGAKEVIDHKCTYCGSYRTIKKVVREIDDRSRQVVSYNSEYQGQRRARKATRK